MTAKRIWTAGLLALALCCALALSHPDQLQAQSRARVVLDIDDSDNVVAPGSEVNVHVWVRYGSGTADYTVRFFHAVNGPSVINDAVQLDDLPERPGTTGFGTESAPCCYVKTVRLVVPLGSPPGKATLSALVDSSVQDDPLEAGIATLTIADDVQEVASARISSAIEKFARSGKRSSTSQRSSGTIYLKLEVLNGRGKLTNDRDVKTILLSANGGEIRIDNKSPVHNHFVRIDDPGALTEFTIKSDGRRAIHIDVSAHVLGEDGSVQSNTLPVNFSGQADSIVVGPPDGTLAAREHDVRIPVAGLDSDGNRDNLSTRQVLYEIVEGPEGADLNLLSVSKTTCRPTDTDCEVGDVILQVNSPDDDEEPSAAHGAYRIEVQLQDDPDEVIHTVEVQVVGEPVAITLELFDGADPDVRKIFSRTGRRHYVYGSGETEELIVQHTQTVYAAVTLSDEDGVLVTDTLRSNPGDGIRFQIAGPLGVSLFTTREVEIQDGVAYISFLVVGDEGSAVIIASSRDLDTHARLVAEEKSRFGLDGLTKVVAGDYTTWIGQNSLPISGLYPLLQARGINAVYLWNATTKQWLTYAQANGQPVPGATDFQITYADTLWLSE